MHHVKNNNRYIIGDFLLRNIKLFKIALGFSINARNSPIGNIKLKNLMKFIELIYKTKAGKNKNTNGQQIMKKESVFNDIVDDLFITLLYNHFFKNFNNFTPRKIF